MTVLQQNCRRTVFSLPCRATALHLRAAFCKVSLGVTAAEVVFKGDFRLRQAAC